MAKRFVVKLGDNVLRQKSKPVVQFDNNLAQLLDDMRETMEHENGVGLAAVQVGVLKRVCVIYPPDEDVYYEFINPKILSSKGAQTSIEGCLSVPKETGSVTRPRIMNIEAYDRHGNMFKMRASGYLAIICGHEFDHMDGILFIDKKNKEDGESK